MDVMSDSYSFVDFVLGAKAFKIARVARVVHSAFVNNLPGR